MDSEQGTQGVDSPVPVMPGTPIGATGIQAFPRPEVPQAEAPKRWKGSKLDPIETCDMLLANAGLTPYDYAIYKGLVVGGIPRQRLLNEHQAMEYLGGISKDFFYRLFKNGRIRKLRLAEKVVRYDAKDLDAYIRSLKKTPDAAFMSPLD